MFLYILYLLTFLVWPVITWLIYKKWPNTPNTRTSWVLVSLFLLHNSLFYFGYSLKGDYVDYIILSLEFFFLCFLTWRFLLHEFKLWRILAIAGVGVISIGLIQGFFGILLFIVAGQDYEVNGHYNVHSVSHSYHIRRYVSGFATWDKAYYKFEVYQTYLLPVEKEVACCTFTDMDYEETVDFSSPSFEIKCDTTEAGERIILTSGKRSNIVWKIK